MIPAGQARRFVKRGLLVVAPFFVLFCLFGALILYYAARPQQGDAEYVALGSSFAAGPGVGERASGSYLPCMRSDMNYAHLFAERAGLSLTDVTCSGATTRDVLDGGRFYRPAQLNAVHNNTKLVTVTIGGNDVSFLGNLVAWACKNDPSAVPIEARWIGVCRTSSNSKVEQAFTRLPSQITKIVEEVHRRAPRGRVILVDYAGVLPETGTCSQLHLSSQEAEAGRFIAMRLAAITAEAASNTNSGLVQASQITRGHDVCSSQPWVYGFEFPKHLLSFGPVPFHPKAQTMEAIAAALVEHFSNRL